MNRDIADAVGPIARAFETLGIEYAIVGSVASSVFGRGRSTLDIDIVADLPLTKVDALVSAVASEYYLDRDAAADAVVRKSMFNAIHYRTMYKVDVYVLSDRPFDRESFVRRTQASLEDDAGARTYPFDRPEDTILHKLEWYRAGGEVSDRQWHDIVGVLHVQHARLDRAYLDRWAANLGLADLLERAHRDAAAITGA